MMTNPLPNDEPTPIVAAPPSFEEQMGTLHERSKASMHLGPPTWLKRPPCPDGPLTADELNQFFHEGFFIKHNVFTREELEPVMRDIDKQVDKVAEKLMKAGRITDLCTHQGFYQRMHGLEKQYKGASVLLHKSPDLPPSIRTLWTDPRLLNVAQQLLGGPSVDLAGHPVWNLRVKVPQSDASVVPWHQDAAYLDPESAHTLQVTAWIPLIDAKAENGCMQMIPRAHRTGKTAKHTCCTGGTWYVEMDLEDGSHRLGVDCKDESLWATCEMPLGSVLFLSNLIPHRSLTNSSSNIRWSLDLRWQDASLPAGFWGIKDPVLMRKASDPSYEPIWDAFLAVDRAEAQSKAVAAALLGQGKGDEEMVDEEEDLDPVIAGPWMRRWELVHHNQHTASLEKNGGTGVWHKA